MAYTAKTIEYVLPTLPGWCTVQKGLKMAETVVLEKPVTCVELGVFGGRSLVALALALKELGRGKVYGVDPYTAAASLEGKNDPENDAWWSQLSYDEIHAAAVKAVEDLNLTSHAEIFRMRSQDAAARFERIDLLHQDSNHSEEVSCAEVDLYSKLLKPGGIWIMDDTDWQTTRKALGKLLGLGFEEVHRDQRWMIFRKAT